MLRGAGMRPYVAMVPSLCTPIKLSVAFPQNLDASVCS